MEKDLPYREFKSWTGVKASLIVLSLDWDTSINLLHGK